MKANVCTSRPTPMKDKKRTRHSTNTSSSSSCTETNKIRVRCASYLCWFRSFLPHDKHGHIFYLSATLLHRHMKPLAFSLMTARVVSAILNMTGVQSSLPVEDSRLSMAPFITSIPEDKAHRYQISETEDVITAGGCVMISKSSGLPMGRDTDVIPRYSTWNFCTSSVFGMGNSAEKTHTYKLKLIGTNSLPAGDLITQQHLTHNSKRFVHAW